LPCFFGFATPRPFARWPVLKKRFLLSKAKGNTNKMFHILLQKQTKTKHNSPRRRNALRVPFPLCLLPASLHHSPTPFRARVAPPLPALQTHSHAKVKLIGCSSCLSSPPFLVAA
jgi:hypothetical protein